MVYYATPGEKTIHDLFIFSLVFNIGNSLVHHLPCNVIHPKVSGKKFT